jgi:FkbM family methyltransferase
MLASIKKVARSIVSKPYLLNRHISRELRQGEPELRLLSIICRADAEFLDVGANEGIYAGYAARFSKKVIALEPHPIVAAELACSVPRNVEVIRAAASDHRGTAQLRVPTSAGSDVTTRSSLESDANPGFGERTVDIELIEIDSLRIDNLAAIKIDVEGHEFSVLAGARRTIARFKPVVIIECEERHHVGGTARLAQFFADAQYDGYFLFENKLTNFVEFDPARMQNLQDLKSVNGGRSRNYVNNFIFISSSSVGFADRLRSAYSGKPT